MHPRVQWAVAKARSAVLLARVFDPDQPRDEDGKWTDGGDGFVSSSPEDFIAARDQSTRQNFLSPLEPGDLSEHTLLMTADKKVGAAIDPQGDLQNVFNNGGPKGAAADVIVASIDKGARTLDCYDGHLPGYYRQFGFEETGRIKFNPAFAHGWDIEKGGQPDVVFMAWNGYVGGDAKGTVERAKGPKKDWLPNEQSSHYASDYDSAKAESRAVARRTRHYRLHREEQRAPTHRAGNLAVARTGESDRQPLRRFNPQRRIAWASARAHAAVLLARAWNESEHPRDPAGTSTGGQFTSGGGTETSSGTSSSGGKKKIEIADFAKDDLLISTETRNNPDRAQKFLEAWNGSIGETPDEFKKHFLGGNGSMTINYYPSEDAMEISGTLRDERGDAIGTYTRNIDFDDRRAVSSYFNINKAYQDRDIGKQVLAANVAMYQKMGIEEVSVHANIDVGGYAWAKYGYVPTRHSWYEDLQDKLLKNIDSMSSGSGGEGSYYSWEEMPESLQTRVERAFFERTFDEFYDSEVTMWREGGGPLETTKETIAGEYDTGYETDWAKFAIDGYRKDRADNGKSDIPYSNKQLIDAIALEYSGDGEGGGDLKVEFYDDKLAEPQGVEPGQATLPGIAEVKPHEHLTDEMRTGLDRALSKMFDNEASEKVDQVDAPEYLAESARESQREYWSGAMEDADKFKWAERNEPDLITGSGTGSTGTGEMSDEDAERLRKLAQSDDPKAIWAIADSKYGKDLLLGTSWSGVLKLTDRESLDRFSAYVAKKAPRPA